MPGTSGLILREHPEDMARARAGKLEPELYYNLRAVVSTKSEAKVTGYVNV